MWFPQIFHKTLEIRLLYTKCWFEGPSVSCLLHNFCPKKLIKEKKEKAVSGSAAYSNISLLNSGIK